MAWTLIKTSLLHDTGLIKPLCTKFSWVPSGVLLANAGYQMNILLHCMGLPGWQANWLLILADPSMKIFTNLILDQCMMSKYIVKLRAFFWSIKEWIWYASASLSVRHTPGKMTSRPMIDVTESTNKDCWIEGQVIPFISINPIPGITWQTWRSITYLFILLIQLVKHTYH